MKDMYNEIVADDYLFPSSLEEINLMNDSEFKEFIFHYYINMGLTVDVPNFNDYSTIDFIIGIPKTEKHNTLKIGILCKRWLIPPKEKIIEISDEASIYNLNKLVIFSKSKLPRIEYELYRSNNIVVKGSNYIQIMLKNLKALPNVFFKSQILNNNQEHVEKREKTKIKYNFDENEKFLLHEIKKFRKEQAQSEKVPRYIIFSNETINQIVYYKPRTIIELLRIYGIGNRKANAYGDTILEIINRYFDSQSKLSD